MSADLFAEGWISVRRPIDVPIPDDASLFAASVHFEAPDRASQDTRYTVTFRFLGPDQSVVGEHEETVRPGQWNRVSAALPREAHSTPVTVELIFEADGPGTSAWYGNLGIDYLTIDDADGSVLVVLNDFDD